MKKPTEKRNKKETKETISKNQPPLLKKTNNLHKQQ